MQQVSKPLLAVGQHLELLIDGNWYASRVEDDSPLCVAWPTDRGRLLGLHVGDSLELGATADALYSASAQVAAIDNAQVPRLQLDLTGPWQRAQRRHNVRADVAIKPRLALRGQTPLRAGISNLSAGGLQLRSQDELRHGDTIELAFELMDVPDEVRLMVRVERVQRADRGAVHVWEAGCAFVDVSPRVTARIVQFIFTQQRALARARRSHS